MEGWVTALLIILFVVIIGIAIVISYYKLRYKVNKYKIVNRVNKNGITVSEKVGGIMPEDLGQMILAACGGAQ